jgi:hypothetical protein
MGGLSLALYEPDERRRNELRSEGAFPVWTHGGQNLLFATSSSDLYLYDTQVGSSAEIVSIPANRYPELKKARPAELSPDERYFALPITRRAPLHADTVRSDQPLWSEHQTLVIGDLERKEIWQHPGAVNHCCWVGISKKNTEP